MDHWTQSFENDVFYFHWKPSTSPAVSKAAAPKTIDHELFDALSKEGHADLIAGLKPSLPQRLFDAMSTIKDLLKPAKPAVLPVDGVRLRIEHIQGTECVKLTFNGSNVENASNVPYQAVLFATPGPDGKCDPNRPPRHLYLMINALVPVWVRSAIGVAQARNAYKAKGFAEEFAEVSNSVSTDQPYQPFRHQSKNQTISVQNRTTKIEDLINGLPLVRAALDGTPFWQVHDVSVTVYHRQVRTFPLQTFVNGARNEESIKSGESKFPLINAVRTANGALHPLDMPVTFPDEYDDFFIDLQWTSPNNLQFFRISNIRVQFA